MSDVQREAQRQQALLRALWRQGELPAGLAGTAAQRDVGLGVYRANAGAHAERALASACPTLAALVGSEALAGLARAVWAAHPPQRGDLAEFASAVPAFIEADAHLADWPYLADVARLDLAVQRIERCAEAPVQPRGLQLLAEAEPATLALRPREGLVLLRSRFPVASIWQAHRTPEPGAVLATLDLTRPEAVLVWRDGWRGAVAHLEPAAAGFTAALLEGASLGAALDAADAGFDFTAWLTQALQQQWFTAVEGLAPAGR